MVEDLLLGDLEGLLGRLLEEEEGLAGPQARTRILILAPRFRRMMKTK